MNLPHSIQIYDTIARLEQTAGCTVGVHAFIEGREDAAIAYHERTAFPAASLIKLFVAYAVLKEYAGRLDTTDVTITGEDRQAGMGVLADLTLTRIPLRDALYFLLAHSDNSAQRALERVMGEDAVRARVAELSCEETTYVPLRGTEDARRSLTSPENITRLLSGLWSGTLLGMGAERTLMLNALAKSRTAYFGLRKLPCALNTIKPEITAHYTKSGKLRDVVSDSMILETPAGMMYMGLFLQNFHVETQGNNVDHAGILHVADLALDVYRALIHHA